MTQCRGEVAKDMHVCMHPSMYICKYVCMYELYAVCMGCMYEVYVSMYVSIYVCIFIAKDAAAHTHTQSMRNSVIVTLNNECYVIQSSFLS